MAQRWTLSNILLKKRAISVDTVKKIQDYSIENSKSERDTIITLGILTEDGIVDLLAEVYHLELANLDDVNFDEAAIKIIPYDVCTKLLIIPIRFEKESLILAVNDPSNITALETLRFYTDKRLSFMIANRDAIARAIQFMYSRQQGDAAAESIKNEYQVETVIDDNMDSDRDEPTIRLTNSIMTEAYMLHASDIHIEPYEKSMIVRIRIDGKLKELSKLPIQAYAAISTRFKLLSGMDIAEKRLPQEGRINLKINHKNVDIRVSTLPNAFGEKLVMRILEKENLNISKERLGFREKDLVKIENALSSPHGIILVTGPTGSGKSTTLYSFLNSLKSPEKAIVTVEDPVEFTIEGINQTPVNYKQGMTFPVALRSILRQDPDVIMIGEIRDEETASIAIRASITGHLVLSTLHTNDAVSTVARLADMSIEPYLLADSLRTIIAQRLMRKICPFCAEEYLSSISEMKTLGVAAPVPLMRATGCKKCNGTGYKGRFAVYEVMAVTPDLKNMLEKNVTMNELRETAVKDGMKTLREMAVTAVLDQRTTMTELKGLTYEF